MLLNIIDAFIRISFIVLVLYLLNDLYKKYKYKKNLKSAMRKVNKIIEKNRKNFKFIDY